MTIAAPNYNHSHTTAGALRRPATVTSLGVNHFNEHAFNERAYDDRPYAEPAALFERPSLSTREVEVLLAWLAAESKEEAAARMFISASTVSTHISRIRNKYAAVQRPAPTKAHLLARALQDGYTHLADW